MLWWYSDLVVCFCMVSTKTGVYILPIEHIHLVVVHFFLVETIRVQSCNWAMIEHCFNLQGRSFLNVFYGLHSNVLNEVGNIWFDVHFLILCMPYPLSIVLWTILNFDMLHYGLDIFVLLIQASCLPQILLVISCVSLCIVFTVFVLLCDVGLYWAAFMHWYRAQ
jgi:hypothetical protein